MTLPSKGRRTNQWGGVFQIMQKLRLKVRNQGMIRLEKVYYEAISEVIVDVSCEFKCVQYKTINHIFTKKITFSQKTSLVT